MDENKNDEFEKNEEENVIEETTAHEENELGEETDDNVEESQVEEENGEEPPKKKAKILPIVAGVLIGTVVVVAVVLLILSMLSPKNTFFRLVNNSFSDVSKGISKIENSTFGKILAIDTSSKLSIDANISGTIKAEDETTKEWFQGLENFSLKAHEDMYLANDYANTNANFVLNGENYLSGNLIKNKNIVSLKLDDVTDGYVTVDNDNLADLWKKIGINGPKSLDTSTDLLKELDFSESDIKDLKKTFGKFFEGFASVFDDEDFAYGEGKVAYDEGEIDCKSMDFIVNALDFNNALVAGLEKVLGNEKYVDSLYKLICATDKIAGYEPLNREDFGTSLEKMLESIRELEITDENEGFVVRIYYKGNDILKFEIRSEDYNTVILEFTCVNNGDSAYYKLSEGVSIYEDKVSVIDNVATHNITANYINYETGEILEGYGNELIITIDSSKKNEQTLSLIEKARIVSYDADIETLDVMAIEPTVVKDYTIKGSVNGDDNNLEVIMTTGDGSYSSTFSVNALIKENADFECLSVNESENFDTTKKSDEELVAKKNEIIEKWNATAGKDSNKFRQFSVATSMYLSAFIPTDYYTDAELNGNTSDSNSSIIIPE